MEALVDSAILFSETNPGGYNLEPNQNFTKTWTIRNNGDVTWSTGYKFRHVSGSLSTNTSDRYLPQSIGPGGTYDFQVSMKAPESGTAEDHWEFVNPAGTVLLISGQPTIHATATVVYTHLAEWVGETIQDGKTYPPGESFTKTWTLKNRGTTAWNNSVYLRRRAVATPLNKINKITLT